MHLNKLMEIFKGTNALMFKFLETRENINFQNKIDGD